VRGEKRLKFFVPAARFSPENVRAKRIVLALSFVRKLFDFDLLYAYKVTVIVEL
jgi:hypothetical protein